MVPQGRLVIDNTLLYRTNMNHHALNRDDASYLPQEYISTVLTNDIIPGVYKNPLLVNDITPDEDTRLECRKVGSRMQFDWALHSFQ